MGHLSPPPVIHLHFLLWSGLRGTLAGCTYVLPLRMLCSINCVPCAAGHAPLGCLGDLSARCSVCTRLSSDSPAPTPVPVGLMSLFPLLSVSLVAMACPTVSPVYRGGRHWLLSEPGTLPRNAFHAATVNGVTSRTSRGVEPSGRHLALGGILIPGVPRTPPVPRRRDCFVRHLPWQPWGPVTLGASLCFSMLLGTVLAQSG